MQEITTKIQTEKGLEEVVRHLHGGKKTKPKTNKKKAKKALSRPAKRSATEYDIKDGEGGEDADRQIKDFKAANRKQIKQIQKGRVGIT